MKENWYNLERHLDILTLIKIYSEDVISVLEQMQVAMLYCDMLIFPLLVQWINMYI